MTYTNIQNSIIEGYKSRQGNAKVIWNDLVDLLHHAAEHNDPSVFNPIYTFVLSQSERDSATLLGWIKKSGPIGVRLDDDKAFKTFHLTKGAKDDNTKSLWNIDYAITHSPFEKPEDTEPKEPKVRNLLDLSKALQQFRKKEMTKGADHVSKELLDEVNARIDAVTAEL